MSTFKSFNQIVASMMERLTFTQPNLDTKPGTVSRDLFIDLPADQIEKLYRVISYVYEKQSPQTSSGSDLDRYGSNFGISRTQGSFSGGTVIFTTNSLTDDIPIPSGSIVTAKNGVTYSVVGNYTMLSSSKSFHASVASRLKRSLQIAGINDPYAIEVAIQATRTGTSGNVSSLQILGHNLQSDLRVVNLAATNGGSNQESDNSFRTRIASVFSGANTGTSLGYRNAAISVNGVIDALIVEPGNSLMLRDGTETIKTNDGSFRILNSGTGGKVDIYILGNLLREISESYIYRDQSGLGNVSDERNDFIIGSTATDLTRTSQERRFIAFKNGVLPAQPVSNIISVFGSESGFFAQKSINESGVISGNYELIKDTNPDTGGSPFSFDRIHFISGKKNVSGEQVVKRSNNSAEQTSSRDINELRSIYIDVSISGENSPSLQSNRGYIQLLHKPVTNITRIQNKTTGEVYSIESQQLDADGINNDGLVKIAGRTMPNQSDILSVDYVWRHYFDKYVDFNGFSSNSIFSDTTKSNFIDWGASNAIRYEESVVDVDEDGTTFSITSQKNISRVISVKIQTVESSTITSSASPSGVVVGAVIVEEDIVDVDSVTTVGGIELYNTKLSNGTFSGKTIFLSTDSPAILDEVVTVRYNSNEIYNISSGDGLFSFKKITLPSSQVLEGEGILDTVTEASDLSLPVYITYIEDNNFILPAISLQQLPISGISNSNDIFLLNGSSVPNSSQPISFKFEDSVPFANLKTSPSHCSISLTDSSAPGKLRINGTSWNRILISAPYGVVFDGLKANIRSEINKAFKLLNFDPSYFVSRVDEVYTTDSSGNKTFEFDINGYSLLKNKFDFNSSRSDTSIEEYSFKLPPTAKNNQAPLSSGATVYIECVISKENDFEDIYFASNKRIISSKKYCFISRLTASSGFRNNVGTITGNLSISFYNQPDTNLSYFANYNFISPKEGERITLRYNINQLLLDVTNSIENFRPITADVLVKEAQEILVDVQGTILIDETRLDEADTILQNASNAISSFLSTNRLGAIIDYSDIISTIAGVNGVDSVNISVFNITNQSGRKSYIRALDNQTINPGNIRLEAVLRKNFRIS
jgi:uncharacterized phage protein gp47/JayE